MQLHASDVCAKWQIRGYGGLNCDDTYRLVFESLAIMSGTSLNYGLVGVGVAILEEVTVEAGLWVSYSQATPGVALCILLPADERVELSVPFPAPCLP